MLTGNSTVKFYYLPSVFQQSENSICLVLGQQPLGSEWLSKFAKSVKYTGQLLRRFLYWSWQRACLPFIAFSSRCFSSAYGFVIYSGRDDEIVDETLVYYEVGLGKHVHFWCPFVSDVIFVYKVSHTWRQVFDYDVKQIGLIAAYSFVFVHFEVRSEASDWTIVGGGTVYAFSVVCNGLNNQFSVWQISVAKEPAPIIKAISIQDSSMERHSLNTAGKFPWHSLLRPPMAIRSVVLSISMRFGVRETKLGIRSL